MEVSRCILFSLLVAIVSALSAEKAVEAEWQLFKRTHGKVYDEKSEDRTRRGIYLENKNYINLHNLRYVEGLETFEMEMNEFGDHEEEEFLEKLTGLSQQEDSRPIVYGEMQVNESVDWRKLGAVTRVKNQGHCGSCWAFSATGAIEAHTFIKTNKLIEVSEQDLIDCSKGYHNNGCKGGLMTNAFRYVRHNDGIDTELSYPYEAEDHDPCRYTPADKGATLSGHVRLKAGDEEHMKMVVGSVGPVAVGVAVTKKFQFYRAGVFSDEKCIKKKLTHGVLVVGYGNTPKNESYWIVKNSWGPRWGDKGFIKLSRNRDNHCGIASMASFPVV